MPTLPPIKYVSEWELNLTFAEWLGCVSYKTKSDSSLFVPRWSLINIWPSSLLRKIPCPFVPVWTVKAVEGEVVPIPTSPPL